MDDCSHCYHHDVEKYTIVNREHDRAKQCIGVTLTEHDSEEAKQLRQKYACLVPYS
jgi:hypothetical protein